VRSRLDQGINLAGADIGGTIAFVGSRVEHELILNGAKVGGSVLLSDGSKFGAVDLDGADIDGAVDAHNSTFRDELRLYAAKVKGSVHLDGSHFANDLNCSGATIEGVLELYGGGRVPTWGDSSEIDLEGSTVGAIDDTEEAWPKHVRLAGLVIKQAHGRFTGPGQGIIDRPTSWYHEWLSRDGEFSRDFYKQLRAFCAITEGLRPPTRSR
jgi:hypothetical protein